MKPDERWLAGPRVRVDELSRSDAFTCINGQRWTYVRKDGALSGVHHVRREDGFESSFAGCAEVIKEA
jgi:hypothetical protein